MIGGAEIIAVFIPIVFLLVTGLVLVTFLYLRNRERNMLIEKGLSAEEMKTYLQGKERPYLATSIGLVIFFFGLGLGIGMMLEDWYHNEFWIPLMLFTFTGAGFVIANLVTKSLELKYKDK